MNYYECLTLLVFDPILTSLPLKHLKEVISDKSELVKFIKTIKKTYMILKS